MKIETSEKNGVAVAMKFINYRVKVVIYAR